MTVEEELIIEMINSKISDSRLENIKLAKKNLNKFGTKKNVKEFLYDLIAKNYFGDDGISSRLISEIDQVIEASQKLAQSGEVKEAIQKAWNYYFPT